MKFIYRNIRTYTNFIVKPDVPELGENDIPLRDEIELAENEVIQSIIEIKYNESQFENMLKILKNE